MKGDKTKLEGLLTALSSHGLTLPITMIDEVRSSFGQKLTIKRQPIPHLVFSLGQFWKDPLVENGALSLAISTWLGLLYTHLAFYKGAGNESSANEACSLASRRLFKFLEGDLRWATSSYREVELLRNPLPKLPDPQLSNVLKDFIDARRSCVRSFLTWTNRIQSGLRPWNLAARRDDSDLAVEDGDIKGTTFVADEVVLRSRQPLLYKEEGRRFTGIRARTLTENSAFTRLTGCATCLTPVAANWFFALANTSNFSERGSDELISDLLWLLELLYGIKAIDAANLGVNSTSSRLGWLTETEIHLQINFGYYQSAQCWHQDILPLPMVYEARNIFQELTRRAPNARKVSEFRSGRRGFVEMHGEQTQREIEKVINDWEGKSCRLDRVWQGTALELGLPASLIGLLRGHPLGGSRGESAYLAASHRQVLDGVEAIHRRIYEMSNVQYRPVTLSVTTNRLYGKRAITLAEFARRTLVLIKKATTFNELMACGVRIFRGLGFRKLTLHFNPWLFYRTEPVLHLEVRDKLMGEWVPPRYPPLSPAFDVLVRRYGDLFGDQQYVSYDGGERSCFFQDLPESIRSPLQEILRDDDLWNAGRTALENALLARKAGDIIRQSIMGHGPMATHLASNQLPVSPARVLGIAREIMLQICAEDGLDQSALALVKKLETISPEPVVPPPPRPAPSSRTESLLVHVPRGMHQPMDHHEKCYLEDVYRRLAEYQFPAHAENRSGRAHRPKNSWPTHDAGFLGLIGLKLHLPLSILLRYAPYYTYNSFVWDQKSEKVYFLVIYGHHDRGGLSESPIEVCSFKEESRHPVIQLLRYRFERSVGRAKYQHMKHDPLSGLADHDAGLRVLQRQLFGDLVIRKTPVRNRSARTQNKLLTNAVQQKREVGDKLAFLFAKGGRRADAGISAFNRLDRIAKIGCAAWHSPLIAGVLSGRSMVGLNRFSPGDVLAAKNGGARILANILGEEWTESKPLPTWVSPKDRSRAKAPAFDPQKGTMQGWKSFFCRDGFRVPSYVEVKDELIAFGLAAPAAASMARRLMEALREEGLLSFGTPLALIPSRDLRQLIDDACDDIESSFQSRAAKSDSKNARSKEGKVGVAKTRAKNEDIRHELVQVLRIAHEATLRPNEILALTKDDFILCFDRAFLFVRRGKSDNAKRMVEISRELSRLLSVQRPSPGDAKGKSKFLFPNLRWHYKRIESPIQNLNRELTRCAERAIKPYDLRHLGIVSDMERAVHENLRSGNLAHAFCRLSNRVGHGSLTMTFSTYLGGGYFLL